MPTLKITWQTQHDDRVCKICRILEGYTWVLRTGQDPFPLVLIHPSLGPVWDINAGSAAHGHKSFNCRCHLVPEFDFSDLLQKVQNLYNTLQSSGVT